MPQKVAVLAPVYNYMPIIVPAMLHQFHKDWELFLIHDGPSKLPIEEYVGFHFDQRLHYLEWPHRGKFGHPIRRQWLEELKEGKLCPEADYIVITNADNYHCPAFLGHLLNAFAPSTVCAYCSHIAHNYFGWGSLVCSLQLGQIDICACVIRKSVACDVGWQSMEHSSDWTFLQSIIQKHGTVKFKKANGTLVTHN